MSDMPKPRILIVDNTPANLEVLVASLAKHDLEVLVAQDGEEALERARYAQPALILLDVLMPSMDGFTACRQLKQHTETADIPVIFMTALNAVEDIVQGFEAGGVDFVSKPFQLAEVLARIQTHLSLRLSQQQLRQHLQETQQEAEFRAAQSRLLEQIARNLPLNEVLTNLITLIEEQCEGFKGSILLLDKQQRQVITSLSRQLPTGFSQALVGLHIGPNQGSCGSAMHHRKTIIVEDMHSDPLWKMAQDLIGIYGLGASWSTPIIGGNEQVLGSFALYHDHPRSPDENELRLMDLAAHYASIAIERHQNEAMIRHLARHDSLTGLPNRLLLEDLLSQSLPQAQRNDEQIALLFIDLDHFKDVNDSLGHHVGDALLKQVAERFRQTIRASDTVARLGGDEFVICLFGLKGEHSTALIADEVVKSLQPPFELGHHQAHIGCSIGISLFPGDGEDVDTLLRAADTAMYAVKSEGRSGYKFFQPELNVRLQQRFAMHNRLHQAFTQGEFELYYQPQVSLRSGNITALEALLRWRHPEQGVLLPQHFLPWLPHSGLLIDIERWVLTRMCEDQQSWQQGPLGQTRLSINLSIEQLECQDFPDFVARTLGKYQISKGQLQFELAESALASQHQQLLDNLKQLHQLGIALILDDFGSGFSSLAYLRQLPWSGLKIHKSFIEDITHNHDSAVVVRGILDVAHHFGMKCVAKGVETPVQQAYLHKEGCDAIQGHLICQAVPTAELLAFAQHYAQRSRPNAATSSHQNLLIVDDDPGICASIRRLLRIEGYQVYTANSAEQGLDLMALHEIGVVLVDLRMPGKNGIDFLTEIKTLHPQSIRLLLTGFADLQVVIEGVNQSSIFKIITKPWQDEALVDNIHEAFRWHRALVREHQASLSKTAKAANSLPPAS